MNQTEISDTKYVFSVLCEEIVHIYMILSLAVGEVMALKWDIEPFGPDNKTVDLNYST